MPTFTTEMLDLIDGMRNAKGGVAIAHRSARPNTPKYDLVVYHGGKASGQTLLDCISLDWVEEFERDRFRLSPIGEEILDEYRPQTADE